MSTSPLEKKPSRSTRRRERSRAALIDAARETMSVKGVDATTIADITEAADLGFGTFYNHFKSKDEIVVAAMTAMAEHFGDEIDQLISTIEDPFVAQIVAWRHVIELATREPIWGWFVLRSSQTLNLMNEGLMHRFRRDVNAAVDAGKFQIVDIDVVATLIGAGILSLVNGRLTGVLDDNQVNEGLALLISHLGLPIEKSRELVEQTFVPERT
jgi:AcrR family transcriptional regulator